VYCADIPGPIIDCLLKNREFERRREWIMKITDYRNHIIAVLGMLILLVLAYLFENWQDWIRESATTTLENKYFYLRLWSVPVAALLFSGCWLILFRFMIKLNSAVVALIYLLVGLSILFYPTIAMTLHVLTKILR